MAFGIAPSRFPIFTVIFMLVFISFVHSSRSRFQGDAADQKTARATQDLGISYMIKSLGKGASGIIAEESAREVPTGPDPLHHNNNPTKP